MVIFDYTIHNLFIAFSSLRKVYVCYMFIQWKWKNKKYFIKVLLVFWCAALNRKRLNQHFINSCMYMTIVVLTSPPPPPGPTKETLKDIWRMVWQERSRTIIMLTNPTETGKVRPPVSYMVYTYHAPFKNSRRKYFCNTPDKHFAYLQSQENGKIKSFF